MSELEIDFQTRIMPRDLAERIFARIPLKRCRHDGEPLPSIVEYYKHSEGWDLTEYGIDAKVWLFIRCPHCNYQYSLWKLGYGRSFVETESMKERIDCWITLSECAWKDRQDPERSREDDFRD